MIFDSRSVQTETLMAFDGIYSLNDCKKVLSSRDNFLIQSVDKKNNHYHCTRFLMFRCWRKK